MSQDPKPDYEAPKVEEVSTEDAPAVTAAGETSPTDVESDLRLKRSLRPLGERQAMSQDPEPGYDAPKVEEVSTADTPAVTAAGQDSLQLSDLRLKRSLRPVRARITRRR